MEEVIKKDEVVAMQKRIVEIDKRIKELKYLLAGDISHSQKRQYKQELKQLKVERKPLAKKVNIATDNNFWRRLGSTAGKVAKSFKKGKNN